MATQTAELVERIWARDATLWTGHDEAKWLGWLDEPMRIRERVGDLLRFAEDVGAPGIIDTVVLLGMGGSSLAPEVLKRTFDGRGFHVLDTTHPAMLRHTAETLDFDATLFIAASKSGTTLETRCHLDYFWDKAGKRGEFFAAITDPGSELEALAKEREFLRVFVGEPTIGGRYSALSVFGMVPAALLGIDLERFLDRVDEMAEACRSDEGNPGLELGLQLGNGWREGRDKVVINPNTGGFGLWAEQLLAESTGKEGKGLIPAPGESPDGPDRQAPEVRLSAPYELGQEFYRWEFATAVAGSILEINPFDQPNVQAAKDKTNEVLSARGEPDIEPRGSVDELLAQAQEGDYVCIQAFINPIREPELDPLIERARAATGCVVAHGLGPRYLHSTGQLHKGGPNTGLFIQVVDDRGDEVPIPGRKFGFRRLINAQAAGDFASLEERGRRIVRVRLEDVS
ncbi:MAG: glucose-6-phosphate isomerase [Actinomycetota bacterium]|nr:glucose-6-phosphate isomerase [Actinomycetota bacterium]